MKRLILGITCAIAITAGSAVSAETVTKEIALDSVKIMVNAQKVEATNIVYEDRTYVPLRAVFETIGCTVEWDEATQTASITGEVQATQSTGNLSTYDEEYAILKSQYDVLIADQEQKGQQAVVERLQKEFAEKEAALKEKYAEKEKQPSPILTMQTKTIELDAITVLVNGKKIPETNILYDDHTYVPLRAISTSIGCEVNWDEDTRTASIFGELIRKGQPVEEKYATYEEEYAALKAKYDKDIANQIALGDQE